MTDAPDALTHTDALSYITPLRGRVRTHTHGKHSYGKCVSVRQVRQCVSNPDALDDLARAVQRLIPDRRDPERFHIDKSEIVATLRRMARGARRG